MSHWSGKYIGLPWVEHGRGDGGFDCWGLARNVYDRELNIVLPCLSGEYSDPAERAEIEALAANDAGLQCWREIPQDAVEPFDLLLFGGAYQHVGVAVDRHRMLHVDRGRTSEIARLDRGRWRLSRARAYRHIAIQERAR